MKTVFAVCGFGFCALTFGCGQASQEPAEAASENLTSLDQALVCTALDELEGTPWGDNGDEPLTGSALPIQLDMLVPMEGRVYRLTIVIDGFIYVSYWSEVGETRTLYTASYKPFAVQQRDGEWVGTELLEPGDIEACNVPLRDALDAAIDVASTTKAIIKKHARFEIREFAPGTTLAEFYPDFYGEDEEGGDELEARFTNTKGATAISTWADDVRTAGENLVNGNATVVTVFENVATAAEEYFSSDRFEKVRKRSRAADEEEDLAEVSFLIGTKADGALEVLAYSDYDY